MDNSCLVGMFTNTFEGPRRVSEHSETIHLNAERLTPSVALLRET